MRTDVEYSPVGEGLGMRDFWLYAWLRRAAVIAAHVTGLGLTLIISMLSRPGTSLFSWHPVLMSVAYCLCLTEGILLFSAEGSPFCFKSRKGKIRLHWFCQALVLITSASGLGFMVASKNISERPHLVSWHSLLGICTLAATALQAAVGICVIFPKLLHLSSSLPKLKLYHATCGLVVYLLATVTVVLAMFSDWFQATVKGVTWWAFFLLPFFPALVVMNQITSAYLLRKKITS
ncbi:cytochrome b561 domain-containing protein 1 [Hippoglossus hippoglossus]|uniref:cytochrome b561 domain-containing protein 1 n=1 Tax=Hippoglossus hippoglossus TaxID=8267 RepID=UPI00148B486C|nr:cytochrome b561 domain-containing protein 1 [Hippoglossus hippoglossus]XP_034442752.1 cytochrome b561 domain-containing protein 1 [Hippoglossus hippoglossus]XP_034442753.1 cytochrome b561 domain-containing protein 1 [Hippoglossus hippoglossus]XP_047195370.1 probable transmembrane reductase CYB561D1 [Hippoglossus stenolepis]XP_047195371.1 probable transmembrane reductase CYB561D1 [Hippoglossus stenolepis]